VKEQEEAGGGREVRLGEEGEDGKELEEVEKNYKADGRGRGQKYV